MNIYDCFTFNDENEILEIRLNELDKYVDYFVIVESGETHRGKKKNKKISDSIIKKFKSKVRYFYIKGFDENLSPWQRENFQRNYIKNGLHDANEEDIVIISDADEIPNLKKFDFKKVENFIFGFLQVHTMYKFNLIREFNWVGSKLCKFKKLKSPQWLRNLKTHKKYNRLRIDKYFSSTYDFNFKLVENGGWHFGWIKNSDEIIKKIESFAHAEFDNSAIKDSKFINKCILNNINFLNTNQKLIHDGNLDLPSFILENKKKYKNFLY
mgnify:CR=1 FL=1